MGKKYKIYIPVVLIILMFLSLIYYRGDMVRYISQSRTEQMPVIERDTIAEYIAGNYNYSQNGENYKYTFLEFGSTGCLACRQMEGVMEEVRSKHGNEIKVIFVNVMKKENRMLSDFFGIATIPTQVLLDENGKEFFRHNGFWPAEEIIKKTIRRQ